MTVTSPLPRAALRFGLLLGIIALVGCARTNLTVSVDVYKDDARQNVPLPAGEDARYRDVVNQAELAVHRAYHLFQDLTTMTEKMQFSIEAAGHAQNTLQAFSWGSDSVTVQRYKTLRAEMAKKAGTALSRVEELKKALNERQPRATVSQLRHRMMEKVGALGGKLADLYDKEVSKLDLRIRDYLSPLIRQFDVVVAEKLNKLSEKDKSLAATQGNLTAGIEDAERRLADGADKLRTERARLDEMKDEVDVARAVSKRATAAYLELAKAMEQLAADASEEEVAEAQAKLDEVKTKLGAAKEDLTAKQEDLTNLEKSVGQFQTDLRNQTDDRNAMKAKLQDANRQRDENQQAQLECAKEMIARRVNIVKYLRQAIAVYNDFIDTMDREARRAEFGFENLRKDLRAARINANAVIVAANQVEASTNRVANQVEALTNRVASVADLASVLASLDASQLENPLASLSDPTPDAVIKEVGRIGRTSTSLEDTGIREEAIARDFYNSQIDRLQNPADPVLREITDPKNAPKWHPFLNETSFSAEGNASVVVVRDRPGAYNIKDAANNPAVLIQNQLRIARSVASGLQDALNAVAGVVGVPLPDVNIGRNGEQEQFPVIKKSNVEAQEAATDAEIATLRNSRLALANLLTTLETNVRNAADGTELQTEITNVQAQLMARRAVLPPAPTPPANNGAPLQPAAPLAFQPPAADGGQPAASGAPLAPALPVDLLPGDVETTPIPDLTPNPGGDDGASAQPRRQPGRPPPPCRSPISGRMKNQLADQGQTSQIEKNHKIWYGCVSG